MLRIQLYLLLLLFHSSFSQEPIIIDGLKLERRFDGIGGLSAGASSGLLPSYSEPQRSEILDYLFLPNFGASLQILKVEIGGDCQSTDGTEASHMHTRDDLNYERGYEWWLMVEAKKRNPDILLYSLSWGVPGWIGSENHSSSLSPFFSQDNIDYHIKWLEGARDVYGLNIDYIGVWNERAYNVEWIKDFRLALNENGFTNTQIVAHDFTFDIVPDMQNDATFKEDVAIVGVHYPGTVSPASAISLGNPLWASEDYSSYANTTGGGCWARILNQNYVNGYMTSTISWALIASYYTGLPFEGCGLMFADTPWSGHYDVQSPIWVSAHTTQFTQPGWIYLAHGNGTGHLPNGGSYVTLVPPLNSTKSKPLGASGDFTLIIETMSHDLSFCIRPNLPPYNVSVQNVTFQIQGGLATNKPLHIWYTQLNENEDNIYFEQLDLIYPENGKFTLSLNVNSVVTVSTLTGQSKGVYPTPPKDTGFPAKYFDDFHSYKIGSEANYFMDQTGVWEVYQGTESLVMRQVVLEEPINWCTASSRPISFIGQSSNSEITVSALIESKGSVEVGLRVQNGGCGNAYELGGYFFDVFDSGNWTLNNGTTILKSGTSSISTQKFFTMGLSAQTSQICAYLNEEKVACVTDSTYTSGFASIGSGWNYAQFDNFGLTTIN